MDNQTLVSIGIPAYNRPQELKKAIEYALNQTYKNLEIIISDNCSPNPDVEKICKEYAQKDSRIKYFRQTENMGAIANYSFVFSKVQGEYFMWCMDDDWLSENYIEECLNFLLEHPDYSIAFGNGFFYDKDYNLVRKDLRKSFEEDSYIERMKKYSRWAIKFCLSLGVTKTDLYKSIYETTYRFPEDWIWFNKTLFAGKGKYLKNITYHALNNGASRNIDSIKVLYNMPDLNGENYWETIAKSMSDVILHDDFFVQRLEESKRQELATIVKRYIMTNSFADSSEGFLKYMYRHPLFIFRKDFYKKIVHAMAWD